MRFGFVTCVQLGVSCMQAIYDCGGALDVAITLEDDMARAKSGRVYLDGFCSDHGIDLVKIRNINSDSALAAIRARDLDWLFIIGWSQIARHELLATPRRGVLGMHPTLLPIGRGRAAIPWAILKQCENTGVTLFQLDEGVDTGPIAAQRRISLSPTTTATELYAAVDAAHVELMHEAFPRLQADTITLIPQDDSQATEWPGRTPEDGAIDLTSPVADAERLVRAVTRPYPGAFVDREGTRLIVWRAEICPAGEPANGPVLAFDDGLLYCVEWEEIQQPD